MPFSPASRPLGVAAASLWASVAAAQPAVTTLEPVVISGQPSNRSGFDTPASVSVVDRATLEAAGPQINLSEALNRVPGISVLNRQNYAQDLQLSIRGFGARSTFGIRGVRLMVDGIPATMPDGQGQASSLPLGSAGRIEVLRGPLAQLYGNAAGGVVQVFTEDDAPAPTVTFSGAAGADRLWKAGAKYSTTTPSYGLTLEGSHFRTRGYRDHSEAQRGQLNGRLRTQLTPDARLTVVLNALEQPDTQDPLGLDRAQWEANPRRAASAATAQDTGKTVRQSQLGLVWDQTLDEQSSLVARVHAGQRALLNALGVPPPAQAAPTSSGGIVQFARHYEGLGLQWQRHVLLDARRQIQWTAGLVVDRMTEDRQGYINSGGEAGDLKRDERNVVENHDVFAQAAVDVSPDWTLTAGARSSRVRFTTEDRFIRQGNGDDSGRVDYHATHPVLGVSWRADRTLHLYAHAGRGFETPTFTEIAYRPAGSGLNTGLAASRSRHLEAGVKWAPDTHHRLDVAAFDIRTEGELVVASNEGGRSTFRNAGRTARRGLELSHSARWTGAVHSTLAVTWLRARFEDPFTDPAGNIVAAGNRLPGAPERTAFADLAWTPRGAWGGFTTAAEVVHRGALFVNDRNTDAAPAVTLVNWRAGWAQQVGAWHFRQWLRVDNLADRAHASSVIVNEGSGRFFEPGLPRTVTVSATARYTF